MIRLFSKQELQLIAEALNSHAYWQLYDPSAMIRMCRAVTPISLAQEVRP